jgi:excisionase family DNA binding protein
VLVSPDEAAALLSLSRSYFNRAVAPDLPRVKAGRRLLFRRSDIERWAEARLAGALGRRP